jgi:predicted DNA-binding transcriptional regulator AlpA
MTKKLLPDPQVCRRYGISAMTLWRWDRDPTLNFPKPIYIRKRKYRDEAELDAHDAACSQEPLTPPGMRTYTLEIGGKPKVAFRAKDDAAANMWPASSVGRVAMRANTSIGDVRIRPATISEQAAWRAHSVNMQEICLSDEDADFTAPDHDLFALSLEAAA